MRYTSQLAPALRRAVLDVLSMFLCSLLLVLSGCDKSRDENSPRMVANRPPELVQSYAALQSGQPAQAQSLAMGYITSNPNGTYHAEAHYLAGKALLEQGDNENAKRHFEDAISLSQERDVKVLSMLGRADTNYNMGDYSLASRQYHWIEERYKDNRALQHDEVMFKLGMAAKKAGNQDWANYWFNKVNELYNTGPYAERARAENTHFSPPENSREKPLVYSLEAYQFGNPRRAEEAAAALRSKGYRNVEVINTTMNGSPTYEVHVGKFTSRAAASKAQVDAKLAGLDTSVRPGTIEPLK